MKYSSEQIAASLSKELLSAISKRDSTALRAVAEMVENADFASPLKDSKRAAILIFKAILDLNNCGIAVQYLDALINSRWDKNDALVINKSTDGHAALRRLAKKLKFPIVSDAIGRPKKTDSKAK